MVQTPYHLVYIECLKLIFISVTNKNMDKVPDSLVRREVEAVVCLGIIHFNFTILPRFK